MFYTDFAQDYEEIFPFSLQTYTFLKKYMKEGAADILDIGCGTGHYCGRFAEDGHVVTGIDLDGAMIQNARGNYPKSDFSVLDLNEIQSIDKQFDLVYSTGNVLSHVSGESLEIFLMELRKKLKKDSLWIFQVINWDYILPLKEFSFPVIETEGRRFIRNYKDIREQELEFHTELQDKKDKRPLFKDSVTMYPLCSKTLLELHKSMGFQLIGHFSDFSGKEFQSDLFSADIYVFSM